MKHSILLIFFLIINNAFCQSELMKIEESIASDTLQFLTPPKLAVTQPDASYNPLSKPNTYAQPDNPNYWRNKKPYEGYWQQDVHYTINA